MCQGSPQLNSHTLNLGPTLLVSETIYRRC